MASIIEDMDPPLGMTEATVVVTNSQEIVETESQERSDVMEYEVLESVTEIRSISDVTEVRSISDDQKLFLKVLENLKNAVSAKPDNKAVALPKNVKDVDANNTQVAPITVNSRSDVMESDVIESTNDTTGISRTESSVRSDPEEPGTTTVTVSDKTKSLILQKLAVASEVDKSKLGGNFSSFVIASTENNTKPSDNTSEASTAAHQTLDLDRKVEVVKVMTQAMGFDKTGDKDVASHIASIQAVSKENVHFASTSTPSPKLNRLIAPATPSVKLFTCSFCDYYSENKNYLKQHIDLVHNSDRPFKCPYCDYAGKRSHALREHLIVHSNERPYQCKSCNATFRKKGHLTNHVKLHNSKRLVKCPLCKVLVYDTGENGLDVHLLNDHDTERLYGCDLCDHIAANEPGILKHLYEKHKSKISLHKCDKCPFQTANKLDFEGHVQAHNITETSVQIGGNAPTKVIGVATIPAGSHNLGLPNSIVKVNPNQDESRQQPAVIKPVWIKCSECGFTGQDSEVIRKHMIEHLKEQYGEEIDPEAPATPTTSKSASAVQTPSKPNSQPVTPKPSMSAPILVPVSKNLDMNAPVLVPVSDPAILKSLHSVPVSVLQLKPASPAAAKLVNSTETLRNVARMTSSSNLVTLTQSNVAVRPVISKSSVPLKVQATATNKPEGTQKLEEERNIPVAAHVTVTKQQLPAPTAHVTIAQQQLPAPTAHVTIAKQQLPVPTAHVTIAQQQLPAPIAHVTVAQQQSPAPTALVTVTQQLPAAPAINFVPVSQKQSLAPTTHVNVAQQQLPGATSIKMVPVSQQQLPAQTAHVNVAQQQLPVATGIKMVPVSQQQLPAPTAHVNVAQQQLPVATSIKMVPVSQQQLPAPTAHVNVAQQQLPVATSIKMVPVSQQQLPAPTAHVNVAQQQLPVATSIKMVPVSQQQLPAPTAHVNVAQQQLPVATGIKMVPVPVRLTTAEATMLTNSVNVKMAMSYPSSAAATPGSDTAVSSLTALPKAQPVSPFRLTEIPVPRAVNANEIPKLPPEFVHLTSTPAEEKSLAVAAIGKSNIGDEPTADQNTDQTNNIKALQEGIANVQKLIDQHEEYSRQTGNAPLEKLDARGIPEKTNGQKVVYYMTPVGKHNTSKNRSDTGFTHDNTAGRFRCTLCGYTCEYQRTIKAHIWKHSGNKDIYYPMFQNGPLSIYEDGNFVKSDQEENIVEVPAENVASNSVGQNHQPDGQNHPVNQSAATKECTVPEGKLPNFIVYEQSKISTVAPALAHLLAARTMVGLRESDNILKDVTVKVGKDGQHVIKLNDNLSVCVTAEQMKSIEEFREIQKKQNEKTPEEELTKEVEETVTEEAASESVNVIVEEVHSISTTGFTGLQSQQTSPRVTPAPRSPDSGVYEQTAASKSDDRSVSSGFVSPLPNFDYIADDSKENGTKRTLERTRSQTIKANAIAVKETEDEPAAKKAKVSNHEDSAVTLLSLLRKGPNYNPACPPKTGGQAEKRPDEDSSAKPGQDDTNSNSVGGESDASGTKPKSGISTSLLAVIEQLRERSKTEPDEDKAQGGQQGKRQSKRRSRKSSIEDNAPAAGIDNVEEFVTDGLVKFRCKLCHYTNDSTMLLKQHMRLHKPKQEFECSLCDHIADSSEALQDHMIQHCKVRIYQCKLCNCAFNYKSQLRAHMRMHNDQDILLCDFCDFETRSVSALKAHTKSHLTKPPYKCEMCNEEFITSFNLRIHKREGCYTSIDKGGNFKCDECEYTTMFRREMKNHQRLHMGKSTIPTKKRCPYCDNVAITIEQIQQHIADVHGASKPLKCEMCGFVAVSIRSLKSHMKRHVNDQRFVAQPLEQYKCNLCGYVCHHLPSLKSHMWRHAADQHYSYEFTNDVINAAIDFDGQTDAVDTTLGHVENFKQFIFDKMKAKGLEHTRPTLKESALACCWVTFRCCQCGFETINKAELNMHMAAHSDVIKWTLDVTEDDRSKSKQATQILHG